MANKNKKIGYYVADIEPGRTITLGTYRFAMNLLKQLVRKKVNLIIFCSEGNYNLFKKFHEENVRIILLRKISKNRIVNRLAFDQIVVSRYIKKEKPDVMIFPKGFIPINKIKGVKYYTVIHDLIPKDYVKDKRRDYPKRLKFIPATILLIRAAKKADKVFTVSEFSKKEISKYTDKEKIKVIPEGVEIKKPLAKLNNKIKRIKEKPYFYLIGNANPHKNIKKAIEIFLEYNKKHNYKYNAVITYDKIKGYEDKKSLIFLGRVSNKELATIYKYAKMSLFLSEIEGFGLPLIESYNYGTPVVFNNKTSLAELGRGLKGACNSDDKKSIIRAIGDVLKMSEKEKQKIKKELNKKYNWKKCAEEVLKELG